MKSILISKEEENELPLIGWHTLRLFMFNLSLKKLITLKIANRKPSNNLNMKVLKQTPHSWNGLRQLVKDTAGVAMIEYAVIIGVVLAVSIGVFLVIGNKVNNRFDAVQNGLCSWNC